MCEETKIHLHDLMPFLGEEAQRIVVRYLHDRGIEAGLGSDKEGAFISYIIPSPRESFNLQFYDFVVTYNKKRSI